MARRFRKTIASQLDEHVIPEPNSGCFLWIGHLDTAGYGNFAAEGRPSVLAHRAAWELAYGPIPHKLHVCHRCDVPCCVNPRHLFLGTARDNRRDAQAKGRLPRGEGAWCAKLTWADVEEIREARGGGEGIQSIADRYGIANSGVSRIANHKLWKTHGLAKP